MRYFFALVWSMCTLRHGPDAMPYSVTLLILLILLSFIFNALQLSMNVALDKAVFQAGSLLLANTIFTFFVLNIRRVPERFVQTLTSLLAVGFFINLILLPLMVLDPYLFNEDIDITIRMMASVVYLLILFFVNLWIILVTANIFRISLSVSFLAGVLVTFALYGFNILVFSKVVT